MALEQKVSKFCIFWTIRQQVVPAIVYILAVGYVPMTHRARTVQHRFTADCMANVLQPRRFWKISPPKEPFAAVKQPVFFIGESLVSSDENVNLHCMLKI